MAANWPCHFVVENQLLQTDMPLFSRKLLLPAGRCHFRLLLQTDGLNLYKSCYFKVTVSLCSSKLLLQSDAATLQ